MSEKIDMAGGSLPDIRSRQAVSSVDDAAIRSLPATLIARLDEMASLVVLILCIVGCVLGLVVVSLVTVAVLGDLLGP